MSRSVLDIVIGVLIGIGLLAFVRGENLANLNPATALAKLEKQRKQRSYEQHVQMDGMFLIDSEGDGPDLYSYGRPGDRRNKNIYFDFDGDEIDNLTGWVSPKELILVRDLDNNGKINGRAEIFADPDDPGMDALRALDANGDGTINALDPGYKTLWLWHDQDRSATSTIDELHSLADVGIAAISFYDDPLPFPGRPASAVATAVGGDGSALTIYQAFLHYNTRLTRESTREDWMVGTDEGERGHFAKTPTVIGQGHVRRLYEAMRRSPELYDAVGKVLNIHPSDYHEFMEALENMIFIWAGTQDVPVDSRGPWVDARKLETLEEFMGTDMKFAPDYGPDPTKYSKNFVMERWWKLYDGIACPFYFRSIGMERFYVSDIYYIVGLRLGKARGMLFGSQQDRYQVGSYVQQQIARVHRNDSILFATIKRYAGKTRAQEAGYINFIVGCLSYIRDNYTLTNIDEDRVPDFHEWEEFLNKVVGIYGGNYTLEEVREARYTLSPLDAPVNDDNFFYKFLYFAKGDTGNPFQIYFMLAASVALFFILRALGNKYITRSGASQTRRPPGNGGNAS